MIGDWDQPLPDVAPPTDDAVARALALLREAGLPDDDARAAVGWLASATSAELAHLVPARVPASDPVAAMIAACDAGLASLSLRAVCRWCGAVAARSSALRHFSAQFTCLSCDLVQDTELDASVEAVFRVQPWFRDASALEPDALDPARRYRVHHFHADAIAPDGEPYRTAVPGALLALARVAAGESTTLPLAGAPDDALEVIALPSGVAGAVVLDGDAPPVPLVLDLRAGEPGVQHAAPGPLVVRNATGGTQDLCALWIVRDGRRLQPASVRLVSPARDLYLHPHARGRIASELLPSEPLGIRDVTVWFSDLAGSTAAYEALGDLEAWRRVHRHFARVEAAIRGAGGAVVNSFGDAVIAVFARAADGLRAARTLVEVGADLPYRVGLHRGPAVAVASHQGVPDVYGHTVNVAARLQAAAGPGEVCASTALGVDLDGWRVRCADLRLRGVEAPVSACFLSLAT